MRLSKFIENVKKKTDNPDPEIFITGNGGFLEIEVLSRKDYYDKSFFGTEFEKGDFICLEVSGE